MKKNFFLISGLFASILIIFQFINHIKYSTQMDFDNEFHSKYILSQNGYRPTLLVTTDSNGGILHYEELPIEIGIEYSFLKQLENKVYFDGYVAKTPSVYDYDTKEINSLPELNKIYDVMNPFSQYPFVTLNNGFAEDGLYNSGACYFEDKWHCKEFENELVIRNGTVFNDLILLYASTATPELDENDSLLIEEKILVYDKQFNLINTYDVYDSLNMTNSTIEFHQIKDKLFLFGTDAQSGEFTILEVNEDFEIEQKQSFSETNPKIRDYCIPASRFSENKDELLLEVLCDKSPNTADYQSGVYQEDNLLLKINLNHLDEKNYNAFIFGDKRIAGVDFKEEKVFLVNRIYTEAKMLIDVYDFNFQKSGIVNFENFDGRTPTLIDISSE